MIGMGSLLNDGFAVVMIDWNRCVLAERMGDLYRCDWLGTSCPMKKSRWRAVQTTMGLKARTVCI